MRVCGIVKPLQGQLPYVVLHHSGVDPPHFDLLVDVDPTASVPTWRLVSWPVDLSTAAKLLRPHRRFYLTYEGPIAGDRGAVSQVATGELSIDADADFAIATFPDGSKVRLPLRDDLNP